MFYKMPITQNPTACQNRTPKKKKLKPIGHTKRGDLWDANQSIGSFSERGIIDKYMLWSRWISGVGR